MSGLLSQGSYTRLGGLPPTGQDSSIPRFHYEPVEDPNASAAAGRPIFFQQERVQIIQPGNPNQPVLLVTDEHRQKWARQYEAFKQGHEMAVDGTPLEQWPILKSNQVLEMKAIGLFTVEQCAALNDHAVQKIGMGGHRIRELAKAYLDDSQQMAITTDALARAERAEGLLAGMQAQLDEQRKMMNQMHEQVMQLRNAPSHVETYTPQSPAYQLQEPVAASSLDGLAEVRRRPGRPRKDEQAAA